MPAPDLKMIRLAECPDDNAGNAKVSPITRVESSCEGTTLNGSSQNAHARHASIQKSLKSQWLGF